MDVKSTATRFREDEEVELELCLSLGGSVRKTENHKTIKTEKSAGDDVQNCFTVDLFGGECVDALSKREIHAVRRQEARKKREAKHKQRRAFCRQRNGESRNGVVWNSAVPAVGKRDCKRMRTECDGTLNGKTDGVNLNLSVDHNALSGPYPGSRIRFPHSAPNLSLFADSTAPFEQVKENNGGNGSVRVDDNAKPVLNGSPVSSSSGVSDPNCFLRQGGNSSDSRTNFRQTKQDEASVNIKSVGQDEIEQSSQRPDVFIPETKPTSNITNGKPPKPPHNGNGINGNLESSLLPFADMPSVTTTGNGPEGKTVKGVLYRYSKSEISIVCMCHGQSFSPAEFIRHAGGTEVSHPLRHITVVPSTY